MPLSPGEARATHGWDAVLTIQHERSGGCARGPLARFLRIRDSSDGDREPDLPLRKPEHGLGLLETSLTSPGPNLEVEVGEHVTLNLTSATDETTTGSSTTTTTRRSTRTRATPIPARSGATSNTTSRLETRPARSPTDLGSTEMGTSGNITVRPAGFSEVCWATPPTRRDRPVIVRGRRGRDLGSPPTNGLLKNRRSSDLGRVQSTEPRSLLIASPICRSCDATVGHRGARGDRHPRADLRPGAADRLVTTAASSTGEMITSS